MQLHRHIRALQSRFPVLVDVKAAGQRFARTLLKRPFESDFKVLRQVHVPPGQVIVDIGGNRGQSIDAIRLYLPDVIIHSFEPHPELAARLVDMFKHDARTTIHACGLGDEASIQPLYTPKYRGFVYDGLASFSKSECEGWLGPETVANFKPDQLETLEQECRIERLDALNLAPAFIKIDVQGYEAAALRGGEHAIRRFEPYILMENNRQGDALLIGWGWSRAALTPQGALCVGEHGALNTLYLPPRDADGRLLS